MTEQNSCQSGCILHRDVCELGQYVHVLATVANAQCGLCSILHCNAVDVSLQETKAVIYNLVESLKYWKGYNEVINSNKAKIQKLQYYGAINWELAANGFF